MQTKSWAPSPHQAAVPEIMIDYNPRVWLTVWDTTEQLGLASALALMAAGLISGAPVLLQGENKEALIVAMDGQLTFLRPDLEPALIEMVGSLRRLHVLWTMEFAEKTRQSIADMLPAKNSPDEDITGSITPAEPADSATAAPIDNVEDDASQSADPHISAEIPATVTTQDLPPA